MGLDNARRLNKILAALLNSGLKMEEAVLKQSAAHNLSITEIHTLEAIGEGKPKTMTHVAAILKINVSTLTAAVNKLVGKGYVNRSRISEDRRIVNIELTETGIQAVREHEAFHLAMINDALSQLSPDEVEKSIQSLDYVNEVMLFRRTNPLSEEKKELTPDRIYQGGMGIGVSMGRLAAAVATCGGVGIISATEPGCNEEDYIANNFEANKRVLERSVSGALKAVKAAGGKGRTARVPHDGRPEAFQFTRPRGYRARDGCKDIRFRTGLVPERPCDLKTVRHRRHGPGKQA